jgi:hypothetical protein
MAVEEHLSCICVDANSINITLNVNHKLREELQIRDKDKLSREIRSVSPTSSNAILTTKANRRGFNVVQRGEVGPEGVTPTEHEIVYYKTCLACREQHDLCQVSKQIFVREHGVHAGPKDYFVVVVVICGSI